MEPRERGAAAPRRAEPRVRDRRDRRILGAHNTPGVRRFLVKSPSALFGCVAHAFLKERKKATESRLVALLCASPGPVSRLRLGGQLDVELCRIRRRARLRHAPLSSLRPRRLHVPPLLLLLLLFPKKSRSPLSLFFPPNLSPSKRKLCVGLVFPSIGLIASSAQLLRAGRRPSRGRRYRSIRISARPPNPTPQPGLFRPAARLPPLLPQRAQLATAQI